MLPGGAWDAWLPSVEGIYQGVQRVGVLILMIVLVTWLIQATDRAQLIGAVVDLLALFGFVGSLRERLAIRLVLVLEAVPVVQEMVTQRIAERARSSASLLGIATAVLRLMEVALTEAESAPLRPVEMTSAQRPPIWQWIWPSALLGLLSVTQLGI